MRFIADLFVGTSWFCVAPCQVPQFSPELETWILSVWHSCPRVKVRGCYLPHISRTSTNPHIINPPPQTLHIYPHSPPQKLYTLKTL